MEQLGTGPTCHSENVDGKFNGESSSSVVSLCRLTMPDWNSGCVDTITESSNDSTDDKLRNTESSELKYRADAENRATEHDGPSTTQSFSKEERKERSKKAANLVDSHHCTL